MNRIFASLSLLVIFGSCTQNISAPRQTTPLVEEIAADRNDSRHVLLNSRPAPDRGGDIVLLGSEPMCAHFGSALMEADFRDNVDAGPDSDGLADFAGETVTAICDTIFDGIAGPDEIRDLVVNMALAAVDTSYNLAKYDLDGLGRKASAKIIVLCDPEYSVSASFDVDTLFHLTGCGIPVISPVESAFRAVLGVPGPKNIAVAGPSGEVSDDVYDCVAEEQFAVLNSKNSEVHAFAADSAFTLAGMLDRYVYSGLERPIDALVVDDPAVDVSRVRAEAENILSVMCPESVTYGRLLSRGFTVISTADVLCSVCYDSLRSTNLFTFKIAAPASDAYAIIPRPDGVDGSFLIVPHHVQDKR